MKKTLSVFAVLGIAAIIGTQSANAFDWSNLNPAYWGHCPKCEKQKADCSCNKKCDPCKKEKVCDPCKKAAEPCPCTTGAAAPCDPCAKKPAPCNPCKKQVTQPCDPCDQLQQMNK